MSPKALVKQMVNGNENKRNNQISPFHFHLEVSEGEIINICLSKYRKGNKI